MAKRSRSVGFKNKSSFAAKRDKALQKQKKFQQTRKKHALSARNARASVANERKNRPSPLETPLKPPRDLSGPRGALAPRAPQPLKQGGGTTDNRTRTESGTTYQKGTPVKPKRPRNLWSNVKCSKRPDSRKAAKARHSGKTSSQPAEPRRWC